MAEDLENKQTEAQPVEQTGVEQKQDAVEARATELYALLSRSDLTVEEKEKVSTLVKEAPEILLQKEFTEKLNMPNLMKEHQSGKDIAELLDRSKQANLDVKQVLDNLKEIEIKGKTGAVYLLNNAYLPNGELVGTQLVKNIHFMATAKKDKAHTFYEDAAQNEAVRTTMDAHLAETVSFYKELYEKPDGYGADKKSLNAANQKVGELMKKCEKNPDTKIEDLQSREFMREPDPKMTEKKRRVMTVAQLKELGHELDYQGALTVAQKEMLNKIEEDEKTKEATIQNRDGNKHGKPEHKEGEAFKDGDVVKYMYEKWFLAGMSWLFDKAEEGLEMMIDKLIDHHREAMLRSEEQAAQAKDERQKELLNKVAFFDRSVLERQKASKNETAAFLNRWKNISAELKDYFINPTPEKESALKSKFPDPEFVDNLKADYDKDPKKVEEFLEKFPQKIKEVVGLRESMKQIAMEQVSVEMVDEVMRSTSAWRDGSKALKKDEALMADYDARVKERQSQIFEAAAVIADDSRLQAEIAWNDLSTPEQKEQFIEKNVLGVYDKLISMAKTDAQKEGLKEEKEHFKDLYDGRTEEGRKLSPEARQEMVLERISALKVQEFVADQLSATMHARQIQNAERDAGHYELMGVSPKKEKIRNEKGKLVDGKNTQDLMLEAKAQREAIIRDGIKAKKIFEEDNFKEKVEAKKSLLEEATESNKPIIFEAMRGEIDNKLARIESLRSHPEERKALLNEYKKRIAEKAEKAAADKVKDTYAPAFHGGRY
ncbi:MAG: hypothetical protein IJ870_04260 [Alphaproteobacteria bacterium]|nr:hypothetical protein [Alphaproteobacteria bacterium]